MLTKHFDDVLVIRRLRGEKRISNMTPVNVFMMRWHPEK